MTEITRISTVTPSITPRTEINVMMDRKVRFGFKYRSARKRLNGSFNFVSLAANSLQFNRACKRKFAGSARGSHAGFAVAPKRTLL